MGDVTFRYLIKHNISKRTYVRYCMYFYSDMYVLYLHVCSCTFNKIYMYVFTFPVIISLEIIRQKNAIFGMFLKM